MSGYPDAMTTATAVRDLERLSDIEREMAALKIDLVRVMAQAQLRGASWEAIGGALGTSRQSAWETYHRRVRELLDATAANVDAAEDELLASAGTSLSRVRARRRRAG